MPHTFHFKYKYKHGTSNNKYTTNSACDNKGTDNEPEETIWYKITKKINTKKAYKYERTTQ
jgi:hypothetical protein